jgi:aromatic ring-opening dioxygenase LigB subunit
VPKAPAASIPGAERTQAAMEELGGRFDAARPQATIVLTPHNVHVGDHFAVVVAANVAGSLEEWDAPAARLTCPVDLDLALLSIEALHDAGLPVVGVGFGANDPLAATAPLDWGTLIPLWVMGGRADPPVPVVVISPCRDRPSSEHVRAGAALARAAEVSQLRVALIASADHGHTHDPDGPYGYEPAAREYDERVVELVRTGRLDELAGWDGELVERAKADSFWQLLMLAGALRSDDAWRHELLSYEAPTYFGMLCAAYERDAAAL